MAIDLEEDLPETNWERVADRMEIIVKDLWNITVNLLKY